MELTLISKAVGMYNLLHSTATITDEQAQHFLQIWEMVGGVTSIKKEEKIYDKDDITLPKPQPVELAPPVEDKKEAPAEKPFSVMLAEPAVGEYLPAKDGPVKSGSSQWPDDMNYRIAVMANRDMPHEETYYLYFVEKPSKQAFSAEYVHFQDRTHRVHVHHRVFESDWNDWEVITITDEYCSWRHKNAGCIGETHEKGDHWHEERARFRIKYKAASQLAKGEFRYIYFMNHPDYDNMQEYNRRYTFVVLERRDNILKLHTKQI